MLTASRLYLFRSHVWHWVVSLMIILWRRAAMMSSWWKCVMHAVVVDPWKLIKARLIRGRLSWGDDCISNWLCCLEKVLWPTTYCLMSSTALKRQAKQMIKTHVIVTYLIVESCWWLFRPCVYLPTHQRLFCYLGVVGSDVPCDSDRTMCEGDLLDRVHCRREFCRTTAHVEEVGARSNFMVP